MRELLIYQVRSEFRKKSLFFSLVLYLVSLVFINYLALGLQHRFLEPGLWSALFWMALLSALVNAVAKSFLHERPGTVTYLYSLASPEQIILSKMVYGFLLCTLIALTGYFFFALWLHNPIQDEFLFVVTLVLTSFGFSAALSLLSAIAAKTNNGSMVMAVLSFPIIIGILLMAIKITKNCIDGLDRAASSDELLLLVAINLMASAFSYLLFPYIWRS
ncbi:MAG: heme exporter protein CcmB [Cyclobacteriaceae bacterium]|nr:heme exporter protein CcmB [Cyclobacteriaceae bacterium]